MIRFGTKFLASRLELWIEWVLRSARMVVAVSIVITAALLYYTVQNISINTNTDKMIDPELDFRKVYAEFNATFPQFADSFLIVIDAASPEEADLAAQELLSSLAARPDLFRHPYAPGFGPFFDHNGFLFLKLDELVALSDQLAGAQPILSALAEDPSLFGFFEVLSLAAEDAAKDKDTPEELPQVLDRIAEVTLAISRGEEKYLSWAEIFDQGDDPSEARRRLVMVRPVPDFSRLQPAKPALLAARALASEIEGSAPGLSLRITGKMALAADELKSVSEGMYLSGSVSLILVTLVLGFGIRSLRLVFASLFTLLTGLVWTAAFAIYAIGYLNIISIAFAVLFIGLGIDFAIHFSLRYREQAQKGAETKEALKATALAVGGPLSLAAPTTALAFFAFTPTGYAGLAQLGLISGTGMFISLFTSLSLLPALLSLMPLKAEPVATENQIKRGTGWIARRGRAVTLGGLLAGLVALVMLPQMRFEIDPLRLKDANTESVEAYLELLEDSKSSPYAIQLVAKSEAEITGLEARLKALEAVDSVVSLGSFVPEDQDEKLDLLFDIVTYMMPVLLADPAATPTPVEAAGPATEALVTDLEALIKSQPETPLAESAGRLKGALLSIDAGNATRLQALERSLLRFFPTTLEKLSVGLEAEGVALDDLPQALRERYVAADGRQRLAVFPTADLGDESALKHFVNIVSTTTPEATGRPVQIARSGEIVVRSMIQATSLAAILIVGFLLLILRRPSDIAFITIPVVLAALMTAAATVLFAIPFNFANVIVLPLLIGLGVDSGIHLVLRAREERSGQNLFSTSTPRAVLLSALTTIGSFGSLALSAHRGTASMGELLTISVALTLISALVILPGLLAWRTGQGIRKENTDF
jgi:hopanoid biosynthesis associated RND transporter like protein HpnN